MYLPDGGRDCGCRRLIAFFFHFAIDKSWKCTDNSIYNVVEVVTTHISNHGLAWPSQKIGREKIMTNNYNVLINGSPETISSEHYDWLKTSIANHPNETIYYNNDSEWGSGFVGTMDEARSMITDLGWHIDLFNERMMQDFPYCRQFCKLDAENRWVHDYDDSADHDSDPDFDLNDVLSEMVDDLCADEIELITGDPLPGEIEWDGDRFDFPERLDESQLGDAHVQYAILSDYNNACGQSITDLDDTGYLTYKRFAELLLSEGNSPGVRWKIVNNDRDDDAPRIMLTKGGTAEAVRFDDDNENLFIACKNCSIEYPYQPQRERRLDKILKQDILTTMQPIQRMETDLNSLDAAIAEMQRKRVEMVEMLTANRDRAENHVHWLESRIEGIRTNGNVRSVGGRYR